MRPRLLPWQSRRRRRRARAPLASSGVRSLQWWLWFSGWGGLGVAGVSCGGGADDRGGGGETPCSQLQRRPRGRETSLSLSVSLDVSPPLSRVFVCDAPAGSPPRATRRANPFIRPPRAPLQFRLGREEAGRRGEERGKKGPRAQANCVCVKMRPPLSLRARACVVQKNSLCVGCLPLGVFGESAKLWVFGGCCVARCGRVTETTKKGAGRGGGADSLPSASKKNHQRNRIFTKRTPGKAKRKEDTTANEGRTGFILRPQRRKPQRPRKPRPQPRRGRPRSSPRWSPGRRPRRRWRWRPRSRWPSRS